MISKDGTPRNRKWVGDFGEEVAAAYLRSKGCKILFRNYRGPKRGEVDIIARQERLLMFVEVKTRKVGARIRGFDAVGKDKQQLIERGANAWLKSLGTRDLPWRFDVIEVNVAEGELPAVNHIRDAF